MRVMKDSGIPWIGQIPVDWEVHPVGYYFGERKNRNYNLREENLLSLSYGKVVRKDINSVGGLLPASFSTYNVVEPKDIIIRPTDLQNDKRSLRTALVTERGIITSAYIDLIPKRDLNSVYYHYLLHSYDVMKVFYNMGNGVRQGLNYSEFAKLMIFSPSPFEQRQIADFLDSKCAEVDALAADVQQEIDVLERYKRSLIVETILYGLNYNNHLKDSGIDWIGQISGDVSLVPLKYILSMGKNPIKAGPFGSQLSGADFLNEESNYWVYNQRSVLDANFQKGNAFVSEEKYRLMSSFHVRAGDVLITTRGTIGKIARVPANHKPGILHPCIIRFRIDDRKYDYRLLHLLFNVSDFVSKQVLYQSNATTIDVIYVETLKNILLPLWDIEHQHQIADFLDVKCSEADSIISEKQKQLSVLDDYKKSVIFEYVTGKKEVPVS